MVAQRRVDGVPQAVVDGQVAGRAPGILGKDIVEEGVGLNDTYGSFTVGRRKPQEEVEVGVPGGEGVAAVAEVVGAAVPGTEGVRYIEPATVITELQLVVSKGLRDRVVDLIGLVDAGLRSIAGAPQSERARDGESGYCRLGGIARENAEACRRGLHD